MARDEAYRAAERKIEEARQSSAAELDLSGKPAGARLTELPESLAELTQLRSLSVRYNNLTALPESLSQLAQLRSLQLGNNELTALPKSLGHLSELQTLDLSSNKLTSIPDWVRELPQLHSLHLRQLQLTSVPTWLHELKQLRALDLGNCGLGVLPPTLRKMKQLTTLYAFGNRLQIIPDWLGELDSLVRLSVEANQLTDLPDSLGELSNLTYLRLGDLVDGGNPLRKLPSCIRRLKLLSTLEAAQCELELLPEWLGELAQLLSLRLPQNQLSDLPTSLLSLDTLNNLVLDDNPMNPELAAAYREGLDAVKQYLRAKTEAQVVLNEAKLILIGEGEVGKSCLLDALRSDPWSEHQSTHGIRIESVKVTDPDTATEITLNGWDFGGQRVYRPTHQLFFSSPAVYLVAWKPREGSQQGSVTEWIRLVKHREPEGKILVVATHGGPGERQPDIGKQELWDLFGHDMLVDFFFVDSKPGEKTGERRGIEELKNAIARVAARLPEMGRTVPARWQEAREVLKKTAAAYLPLEQVLDICRERKMDNDESQLFLSISHRLGHLIHYQHDPLLRDLVVLKPDWLATAISFVLDDEQTREAHGLVSFDRLSQLWNDSARNEEFRYPPELHPVFLRLMERFDLSYRVAHPTDNGQPGGTSLIAQLVPDTRPDPISGWASNSTDGDEQQVQICRIVDAKSGQSAAAEGLFYQLIVRLHRYSLGRVDYQRSVHWQRGLVLDDDYNGRALMDNVGNDIRITVRAAYPERFLSVLTNEVKWLVENFWAGLRCEVVVPCVEPCGKNDPGQAAFEVQKLIAFKRQGMGLFPCVVSGCDQAQDIDRLLRNAPAARRTSVEHLLTLGFDQMRARLDGVREQLSQQDRDALERFTVLDQNDRRIMSQVEDAFTHLMQVLTDEAKEGPRLFSFQPIEPGFFDRPKWISEKFRLTLWCEHSRLPLPVLNGNDDTRGVYDLNLTREWFVKAAPFLKVLAGTLSLVLPVASSATKLMLDETAYKGIEKQLELGNKSVESITKGGEKIGSWLEKSDAPDLERGESIQAQGGSLRQLHAFLQEKDPSFGGLVRVRNKRQEFLWVHPQFEKEY